MKENWESDAPQGWLARDHDDWCTSHQMIKGLAKVRRSRLHFHPPFLTLTLFSSGPTQRSYLAIVRRLSGSTRWHRNRTHSGWRSPTCSLLTLSIACGVSDPHIGMSLSVVLRSTSNGCHILPLRPSRCVCSRETSQKSPRLQVVLSDFQKRLDDQSSRLTRYRLPAIGALFSA